MGWAGGLPDLGHQAVTELMGTPVPMQGPALHRGDVSGVHWLREEHLEWLSQHNLEMECSAMGRREIQLQRPDKRALIKIAICITSRLVALPALANLCHLLHPFFP